MVIPRRLLKGVALLPLILTVAMVAHSPTEAASFTDVTSAAGLSGVLGFRCAVADINGDGYPDLLLHRQSFFDTGDVLNKQYVYLNVPGDNPGDPHSRKFVDRTAESGVRADGATGGTLKELWRWQGKACFHRMLSPWVWIRAAISASSVRSPGEPR